jgi:hypothetical protein
MADEPRDSLSRYPLLDALRDRRSRRFGVGMRMESGPLAYRSTEPGLPLTEDEEAVLAFAACGITGYALADLGFEPGQGGTIMAGLAGRTVPSGDAIQTVSVFVTNERATYFLKRPRDFDPRELPELGSLARRGEFTELYRRSRVEIKSGRAAPPLRRPYNLAVNDWSLYDPASTYFLPVNELTFLYINGLLEILDETSGCFILDERAMFRPAGLRKFAASRGGHLKDDPRDERILTIQQLESLVTEFVTIEQGMIVQNLALMTQAMGLGGFPHWAAHPFGWLDALGFRTRKIRASRYLGMGSILSLLARVSGRDSYVPMGVGIETDGKPLLLPYCPPHFPTMEAAVAAVVDHKFGAGGVFRGGARFSAWVDPAAIERAAKPPSQAAQDATKAFCEYVYHRYGRFPAYQPPFRTVLGFQAGHADLSFYERFYRPEALSETQREHMARWHPTG